MASVSSAASLLLLVFLFSMHVWITASSSGDNYQQAYIVYVSRTEKPPINATYPEWYSSILQSLSPLSTHQELCDSDSSLCSVVPMSTGLQHSTTKLLYSYEHAMHGFAARLSASQAAELRRRPGIISVIPDSMSELQTTRSPQFLGLANSSGLWPNTNYGDDIIIGVVDTGIQHGHRSFSDAGLSPVPASWRGGCEMALDFPSCDRKVIGARAFYRGYEEMMGQSMEQLGESRSPADYNGHGTHVASTAAGSLVRDAGFFEYARGEAKGVAVRARIAAYKVCWRGGCSNVDTLAALNQAISDGVHVLSVSLATRQAIQYDIDPIAVGAFNAAERGILTSAGVGNSGPNSASASNIAPWILTVGASTIDRELRADVVLGDGSILQGVSLYSGNPLGNAQRPLVYASDIGSSRYCRQGELIPSMVRGRIVVCDVGGGIGGVAKGYFVQLAGGVGMVLANTEQQQEEVEAYLIPAAIVGVTDGNRIKNYIRTQSWPTATIIFRGTMVGPANTPSAPRVGVFSSRGPNAITGEILKPDVIAPGVSILAAWSRFSSPTRMDNIDGRRVEFNIISGTSMATPHVSGIAALLRKAHPNWSSAAIKSAIMTTAYTVDNNGRNIVDLATGRESTPFDHGSGHVNPSKAVNPGLVYDMGTSDYVQFFCSIGYTPDRIAVFVSNPESCRPGITPGDLNYPSFSVVFSRGRTVVTQRRTVKNVGSRADAVYTVSGIAPRYVQVVVAPGTLVFDQNRDTLTYQVTFTSAAIETIGNATSGFGYIEWSDGQQHTVRSPIAVQWNRDSWVDSM